MVRITYVYIDTIFAFYAYVDILKPMFTVKLDV